MAIKRTPGMTLKEFCKDNNATQITIQHADNDRVTHIAGFKKSADYELQEGQTMWFRVGGTLIEKVYKKPTVVQKITTRLKGRR